MARWGLPARSRLLLLVPLVAAVAAVALYDPPEVGAAAPALLPPGSRAAVEGDAELGDQLYQRDCAFCHGVDGRGTSRGQNLTEVGPAEAHYSITTGRMPIEEPGDERRRREVQYKAEEVDALIAHMRKFLAPEPDIPEVDLESAKLSEGLEIYLAECAGCHQWSGAGGALLGREAPGLKEATPTQIAEAVRTGPPSMPAYGEEVISEEELNSVVKYVLYLRAPQDRGGNGLWHLGPFAEGLISWVVGIGVLILGVLWIGERGTGVQP
ncbi:MAG: c-type cytochrome [Actinomycetota bacterium]|nr:c-type cytochrome [Actinomycetota bacterium]